MGRLGTWFSGGLGSVRFTLGLNDLKGLFQPKRFYNPMIISEASLLHTYRAIAMVSFQFPLKPSLD